MIIFYESREEKDHEVLGKQTIIHETKDSLIQLKDLSKDNLDLKLYKHECGHDETPQKPCILTEVKAWR